MLIVFPLGLLATAVTFDLIHIAVGSPVHASVAYRMIAAGIIGGFIAAPFGWIDWFYIPPGTRKIGGALARRKKPACGLTFHWKLVPAAGCGEQPDTLALILSFSAAALALVTAWLGGELVDRLGIGVDGGQT